MQYKFTTYVHCSALPDTLLKLEGKTTDVLSRPIKEEVGGCYKTPPPLLEGAIQIRSLAGVKLPHLYPHRYRYIPIEAVPTRGKLSRSHAPEGNTLKHPAPNPGGTLQHLPSRLVMPYPSAGRTFSAESHKCFCDAGWGRHVPSYGAYGWCWFGKAIIMHLVLCHETLTRCCGKTNHALPKLSPPIVDGEASHSYCGRSYMRNNAEYLHAGI